MHRLSLLGKVGGKGPLRAKPNLNDDRFAAPPSAPRSPAWTNTGTQTAAQNAYAHWKKHGSEFPELRNALEYAKRAHDFVKRPPASALTKARVNGDIVVYDPVSNTLVVCDVNHVPRTMFKPDPAKHGHATNLDYFHAQ